MHRKFVESKNSLNRWIRWIDRFRWIDWIRWIDLEVWKNDWFDCIIHCIIQIFNDVMITSSQWSISFWLISKSCWSSFSRTFWSAKTLSKFLCFLSKIAAFWLARSKSPVKSSMSPQSRCLVFSKVAHFAWAASTDSSASWRRPANFFLASSSSSVLWIASVSYLFLQIAISPLA